jgi:thiol:disulfide interchange protein DsbD
MPWQPLRADAVAQISALHRPALVEFTAAWCLNCRVMERTVYRDPAVLKAVRESGAVALQADLTRPDPALQHLLTRYGGSGLPFLAVLDSQGREVGHFSGLFTADTLIGRLHGLPTSIVSAYADAPRDSADEVGARVTSTPAGALVTLDIARGWHVYSNPPSTPYLIPASVTVFRAGRALPITPRYPPGQDIGMRVAGKTILVYENGARIDLPGLTDVRAVQVRVRVQACKDSGLCLPPAIVVARPPSS